MQRYLYIINACDEDIQVGPDMKIFVYVILKFYLRITIIFTHVQNLEITFVYQRNELQLKFSIENFHISYLVLY